MGIAADQFDFPTNGSGSPDSQATPRATVRLLAEMAASDVAAYYRAALPRARSGRLAGRTRGMEHAGPGPRLRENRDDDRPERAEGPEPRRLHRRPRRQAARLRALPERCGPIQSISDVTEVFEDEAAIANAIYETS